MIRGGSTSNAMHWQKILLPSAVMFLILAAASTRADPPHDQVPCLPSSCLHLLFLIVSSKTHSARHKFEMNEEMLMGAISPTTSPEGPAPRPQPDEHARGQPNERAMKVFKHWTKEKRDSATPRSPLNIPALHQSPNSQTPVSTVWTLRPNPKQ